MGEATAAEWTEGLRRTGRVVFPTRPRGVLAILAGVWLFTLATQLGSLISALEDGGVRLFVSLLFFAFVLGGSGWLGWLVATKRPVLTVDGEEHRAAQR